VSLELEPRVETLEALMADTLRVVRATSLEVDRLSREMREFKDEMRSFKAEINKRWGDLAASLGTVVEDIVAPSIPRVLREVFACPAEAIEFSAVRLRRKHPTLSDYNREFDTVAAGCSYFLTVESKIRLDIGAVNEFAGRLPEVKEFFPEFAARGYRFVGAVAGLYVDPSVAAFAEKRGLIVLGTGDDLMTVLNSPGFTPRAY
jgi:hypothetical protein